MATRIEEFCSPLNIGRNKFVEMVVQFFIDRQTPLIFYEVKPIDLSLPKKTVSIDNETVNKVNQLNQFGWPKSYFVYYLITEFMRTNIEYEISFTFKPKGIV